MTTLYILGERDICSLKSPSSRVVLIQASSRRPPGFMGSICSKSDTHTGGHVLLASTGSKGNGSKGGRTLGGPNAVNRPREAQRQQQPVPSSTRPTPSDGPPVPASTPKPPKPAPAPAPTPKPQPAPPAAAPRTVAVPQPSERRREPPRQVTSSSPPRPTKMKTPPPTDRREAAALAAEQRVKATQSRGTVSSNPKAGQLSAQLEKQNRSPVRPEVREEPRLVWD